MLSSGLFVFVAPAVAGVPFPAPEGVGWPAAAASLGIPIHDERTHCIRHHSHQASKTLLRTTISQPLMRNGKPTLDMSFPGCMHRHKPHLFLLPHDLQLLG